VLADSLTIFAPKQTSLIDAGMIVSFAPNFATLNGRPAALSAPSASKPSASSQGPRHDERPKVRYERRRYSDFFNRIGQQATTCAAAITASRLPGQRAVGTILKSPMSETVAPRLSIIFFLLYPSSIITLQALRLSSIAHSQGQKCEWQVQPILNRL
jgi:hypothetical protein